jgi:hypothetical protein
MFLPIVMVLAAACSHTDQGAQATARPRPAISPAQARQVLTRFQDINNRANAARDDRLISTIEAGAGLRESLSAYKVAKALKTPKFKAFTYDNPSFYIPKVAGFPKWFAVHGTVSKGKQRGHGTLLFEQDKAGAAWLRTAGPPLLKAHRRPLPVALGPDGYASAVAPGDGRLAGAAARHAACLNSATTGKGTCAGMAPGTWTSEAAGEIRRLRRKFGKTGWSVTSAWKVSRPVAGPLRTPDGVLFWYELEEELKFFNDKGHEPISLGKDWAALADRTEVLLQATITREYQFAAIATAREIDVIASKGSPTKVRAD